MDEARLQAPMAAPCHDENNTRIVHQAVRNRRALSDIGNLVGALSARCTVSKVDGSSQNTKENPDMIKGSVANRSMARKFGATVVMAITKQQKETVIVTDPAHTEKYEQKSENDLGMESRAKQRRTEYNNYCQPPLAEVHDCDDGELIMNCRNQSVKRNHHQKKIISSNQLTLTEALITARRCDDQLGAESGGYEVEMEEAEEALPYIDEKDEGNPLCVVEYVEDIYDFYRETENQSCVPPDYMSRQTDINEKMRAILIDWLIEVHLKFKLMPETLFLTINLIDRFLACQAVMRKNLQLVGVAAMLLASKYEEIWAPEVHDFVYISDKAYTKEQVLDMEKQMLNKLQFNLTVPTPYVFLVRFLKAASSDTQLEMLAFFLVELCLTEYCMMKYSPSHLAAAALYTAHHTLDRKPHWTTTLHHHSGYTEMHLRECALKMVSFHRSASKGSLTVVHKKYSNPKFNSVATLDPAATLH